MNGFYGYKTLMKDAKFISHATVNGDLRFFCSDYPVMVKKTKGGKPIKGELYLVDEKTMKKIRNYEGIGNPFTCYTERVVKAKTNDGVVTARAFVVIPQIEIPMLLTSRHIPECDWRQFKSANKRLPIPKPLILFLSACILSAVVWELFVEIGHL